MLLCMLSTWAVKTNVILPGFGMRGEGLGGHEVSKESMLCLLSPDSAQGWRGCSASRRLRRAMVAGPQSSLLRQVHAVHVTWPCHVGVFWPFCQRLPAWLVVRPPFYPRNYFPGVCRRCKALLARGCSSKAAGISFNFQLSKQPSQPDTKEVSILLW